MTEWNLNNTRWWAVAAAVIGGVVDVVDVM